MAIGITLIRSSLLYESKLGTEATVAARKICTSFGDDAVSVQTAQKWIKKFFSEDLSLANEAHSGRPKITSNEDLKQIVEANSNTTCLELEEWFSASDETIRLYLHQLGKTKK
ncbi:hypothetical protein Trydic_g11631 [Trypoxylus dichotomus]